MYQVFEYRIPAFRFGCISRSCKLGENARVSLVLVRGRGGGTLLRRNSVPHPVSGNPDSRIRKSLMEHTLNNFNFTQMPSTWTTFCILNLTLTDHIFRNNFFLNNFFIVTTSIDIHIVVYTYSKITSHKKSYKIFDFKSRDSTFYNAIEKRRDVSSM